MKLLLDAGGSHLFAGRSRMAANHCRFETTFWARSCIQADRENLYKSIPAQGRGWLCIFHGLGLRAKLERSRRGYGVSATRERPTGGH